MAAAPTAANARVFLLVRANVVDLDDPRRFFYVYFDQNF